MKILFQQLEFPKHKQKLEADTYYITNAGISTYWNGSAWYIKGERQLEVLWFMLSVADINTSAREELEGIIIKIQQALPDDYTAKEPTIAEIVKDNNTKLIRQSLAIIIKHINQRIDEL